MSEILFYAMTPPASFVPKRLPGSSWQVDVIGPQLALLASKRLLSKFAVGCWFLHSTRQFLNRDCRLLVVSQRARIASYCWAHPGFYRYPFMGPRDLQIGKVFTDPDDRGRGLAAAGVSELVWRSQQPGRTIWYLTSRDNTASIRVAEKLGFELRGLGGIRSRWGTELLGRYEVLRRAGAKGTGQPATPPRRETAASHLQRPEATATKARTAAQRCEG